MTAEKAYSLVAITEIANRMLTSGTSPLTVQYDRQPFVYTIPNSVTETAPGVFTPNTEIGEKPRAAARPTGTATWHPTR